jgi:hypothetical protein
MDERCERAKTKRKARGRATQRYNIYKCYCKLQLEIIRGSYMPVQNFRAHAFNHTSHAPFQRQSA